jgi:hypothetical protein
MSLLVTPLVWLLKFAIPRFLSHARQRQIKAMLRPPVATASTLRRPVGRRLFREKLPLK